MASGAEIYRSFQEGDVSRLEWALEAVEKLSKEFEAEAKELKIAHDQMMEYWEGDSADAAGKGVNPLIEAHRQSAPLISDTSRSMSAQAGSFSESKNAVVPVPDEPAEPGFFAKAGGILMPGTGAAEEYQSYRDGMAAHEQANANNVRVMEQYTSSTDGARSALPSDFGIVKDDGAVINVETRAANAVASQTASGPSVGGASGATGAPGGGAPLAGGYTGGPTVGAPGTGGLQGGTTSGVQQPSAPAPGTPGTPAPTPRPVTGTPIAGGPLATPAGGNDDTTRSPRGRGTTAARPPAGTSRAGSRMSAGSTPKSGSAATQIPRGANAAAKYSGTPPQPGKSTGIGSPTASGASTASAAKGATSVGRGVPGAMAGAGGGRGQGDDDKEHKDKYAIKEQLDTGLVTEVDELGEKVVDEQTGTTVVPPVIGDLDEGKG
ncbi:MAG: PPE domain-containing protein [Actinophytocola sp.]|nr:PPE domain-containing protein [Actinophytocola sp.]